MFKIIKTSTYNKLLASDAILDIKIQRIKNLEYQLESTENKVRGIRERMLDKTMLKEKIKNLELQLHTLTAKKLPIKKSKNK